MTDSVIINGVELTPEAMHELDMLVNEGLTNAYTRQLDEVCKLLLEENIFADDKMQLQAYKMIRNLNYMKDTFSTFAKSSNK